MKIPPWLQPPPSQRPKDFFNDLTDGEKVMSEFVHCVMPFAEPLSNGQCYACGAEFDASMQWRCEECDIDFSDAKVEIPLALAEELRNMFLDVLLGVDLKEALNIRRAKGKSYIEHYRRQLNAESIQYKLDRGQVKNLAEAIRKYQSELQLRGKHKDEKTLRAHYLEFFPHGQKLRTEK